MRTLFISLSVLLTSCSVFQNTVQRNHYTTSRNLQKLYKQNNNSIGISTSYSDESIIWSYLQNSDSIIVYVLSSGKIKKEIKINNTGMLILSNHIDDDYGKILDCMELDGDILYLNIDTIKQALPVNIKCFKDQNYQSDHLKKISKDIALIVSISNSKVWEKHINTKAK